MSSLDTSSDRRGSPRARFSGITILRAGAREMACVAGDLSVSGMLVYPQQPGPAPRSESVKVVFTLPNLSRWIEVAGHVVRTEQQRRPTWGLRFDTVAPRDRRLLRAYVEQQQSASEAPTPPPTLVEPATIKQGAITIEDRSSPMAAHELDESSTTRVWRRESAS